MAKELYRQINHENQRGTLSPRTEAGGAGYFDWIARFERPLLVRTAIKCVREEKEERQKE